MVAFEIFFFLFVFVLLSFFLLLFSFLFFPPTYSPKSQPELMSGATRGVKAAASVA